MTKTVGVLLSGCGYLDGSEIRESVITLLALDQKLSGHDVEIKILAPDRSQHHVINHVNGEVRDQERSLLEESARIARGKVTALSEQNSEELAALILPGGFGVAKNLCTWAFDAHKATVYPLVEKLIREVHEQKKPIGAVCIAPALIGLILGNHRPVLTLGLDQENKAALEKTGAKGILTQTSEICIDNNQKIVSTPAYMDDNAKLSDIYEGIGAMVQQIGLWL